MCLILIAINFSKNYKLVVAANRDEFYDRPTAQLNFWFDEPNLLAGKDLKAGGTWLGITQDGRIAAVTNYRDFHSYKERKNSLSRGKLVTNFLSNDYTPKKYSDQLLHNSRYYNPFNLIFGTVDELFYFSNIENKLKKLSNGIHGLSNHLLDTPWPKIEKSKNELSRILSIEDFSVQEIFKLLADESKAEDDQLPDTGVGLEYEKVLSSIFIKSPNYGTRSSSLITVDQSNNVFFSEKTFNSKIGNYNTVKFEFQIKK